MKEDIELGHGTVGNNSPQDISTGIVQELNTFVLLIPLLLHLSE